MTSKLLYDCTASGLKSQNTAKNLIIAKIALVGIGNYY